MQLNIDLIYPIGAIYLSTSAISPEILFGGEWEPLKDRFLVGVGDTYASEETGGDASHNHTGRTGSAGNGNTGSTALTVAQMPSHAHYISWGAQTYQGGSAANYYSIAHPSTTSVDLQNTVNTGNTGSGQGHTHTLSAHDHTIVEANNLPPYLAVYMWRRVK